MVTFCDAQIMPQGIVGPKGWPQSHGPHQRRSLRAVRRQLDASGMNFSTTPDDRRELGKVGKGNVSGCSCTL
jgi:hypothetical protein